MIRLEREFHIHHQVSKRGGHPTEIAVFISSKDSPRTVKVTEGKNGEMCFEYIGMEDGKKRFLGHALMQGLVELVKIQEVTVPELIPNMSYKRG
ncbi:MAG TPA: hypothetical protein VFD45_01215 [Patescibacteria group bacterium]|nr:hypothetical protein [Patescibacteria group bacterium]